MRLLHVVGARPNFMKIAPIIEAVRARNGSGRRVIEQLLVHTGQHYDERMSRLFFDELGIPKPDVNLDVGSGSHAAQTAEIMKRFEPVCLEWKPTHVLVVGDVNSTIACALTAVKLGVKVVHVEAGLRSFNRTMPEEINRVLTDAISDYLFVTEPSGEANLLREGIAKDKIHFVGNVMIDTLLKHRDKARASDALERLGLAGGGSTEPVRYGVVTLHRPSNVDDPHALQRVLAALGEIAAWLPLVFPVHPRTRPRLERLGGTAAVERGSDGRPRRGLMLIEPLGYLDFLCLMSSAALVLTDSGGIQEETTVLGVPCVTLREETERPITLTAGANVLAGTSTERIVEAARAALPRGAGAARQAPRLPPLWDGRAADRIVDVLSRAD